MPAKPRHSWAAALGVTPSAVWQLMLADGLRYVTALNARRYVRWHQLDVANVRGVQQAEDALVRRFAAEARHRRHECGYPIGMLQPPLLAKAHGAFNIAAGLWPLAHLRSFEAVFGPKADRWLEYTVAGLLTSVGYAQWVAGTEEDWPHARRLGLGTAATLLAIDLIYVPRGRIRWTYLIDAVEEAALIGGWVVATRNSGSVADARRSKHPVEHAGATS